MRCFWIIVAALFLFAAPTLSLADEVHTLTGERHAGSVQSMSTTEIVIGSSGKEARVPVNEIASVSYSREPQGLKDARESYGAGRYDKVIADLREIKGEQLKLRDELPMEIDFYRAATHARRASLGNVEQKAAVDAGRDLLNFLQRHPNSYHFYEANEVLGDLLASLKNPRAASYYDVIAAAPFPDYKIRAAVLKGRAAFLQGDHATAVKFFDSALQSGGTSKPVEIQLQFAMIGKAACLVETGNVAEARKLLEEVIAKADDSNREIYARAYNVLGACHRKRNEPKDALLAYLHVDLLFNSHPDAHAEALHYLSVLWEQDKRPDRAKAALDTLKERYAASRWNKS